MSAEPEPKLSGEGTGAILVDVAAGAFDPARQSRIWQLAEQASTWPGVSETVPGMNNLMVVFDPFALPAARLEPALIEAWSKTRAEDQGGTVYDVPVSYGGSAGPDLDRLAADKNMRPADLVDLHRATIYSVAAVGAMPGFVYLSGLDPQLAAPRLANPRAGVPKGSVIIGGAQAGIMPVTAPSGWHILGHTTLDLFDPFRARPALFRPGDRIRFVAV